MKKNPLLLLAFVIALLLFVGSCAQPTVMPALETIADEDSPNPVIGNIELQPLLFENLPDNIKYTGDIVEIYAFTDATGENIVVATETEVVAKEVEEGYWLTDKSIYAYRFTKKNDNWQEVWKTSHHEKECMNYAEAAFVEGALSVTDLDGDGVAEVWVMYVSACRGDVSPASLSLIMNDGKKQYTVSGEAKLVLAEEYGGVIGGEYILDNNLLDPNTPPAFVTFAKELWEKYQYEK